MPCHRVPVPADRPLMLIVMAIMLIPALTAGNYVGGHAGAQQRLARLPDEFQA